MMEVDKSLQTEEPPVDSLTTRLPESNPPLTEARQFKNPFQKLHLAARWAKRLALILLTLSGVASDSKPVLSQNIGNNTSKTGENNLVLENTPPYQDILQSYPVSPRTQPTEASSGDPKIETLSLTAREIFGNNVTTEEELRTSPENIKDAKIITNQQGQVEEIITLAEDDKRRGIFVTRIMLDPKKGTFREGFQTTTNPLSIEAESIAKVGRNIVVGGQTEWSSGTPALLQSSDSVRPFEPIDLSSTNLSRVAEMNQIPNTSKVILIGGLNSVILDTESGKAIQTLGKSGSGVIIATTSEDNQTAAVYSRSSNGLLKELINLSSGQILESQTYFRDVYIEGYGLKKDSNNSVKQIITTDNPNQQRLIFDLATNTIKRVPYSSSIEKIPVTKKNLLDIRAISVINNWVWEAGGYTDGDGGGGLIISVWSLSSDPNIDSKSVYIYTVGNNLSGSVSQKDIKWGIFGDKPGILINYGFTLVFMETNLDGSPIEGAKPVHISIKDKRAPTTTLPVVLNTTR